MTLRPLALTGAAWGALALTPRAADAQGDFHWKGPIAPGKRLEIKGVNGYIRATVASGDQAEVSARRHARRSDPASVEIKVVTHDAGVTICAVYPTPEDARRPNECAPGRGYHSNTEDNDVVVDFTVQVPAGVELSAQTVNGAVEATGLRGNVETATVNGGIDVSTTGHAV